MVAMTIFHEIMCLRILHAISLLGEWSRSYYGDLRCFRVGFGCIGVFSLFTCDVDFKRHLKDRKLHQL